MMGTPFDPWIAFARETAPGAAALVFTFVLAGTIVFALLLVCAGDPRRMLRSLLVLGPIAGAYFAIQVAAFVAMTGWPVLWLLEQLLGLPRASEARVISLLSLNYASTGIATAAAVGFIVVLITGGIWQEQGRTRQVGKEPRSSDALFEREEQGRMADEAVHFPNAEVVPATEKRDDGRLGGSYRRIGVIVGALFALVSLTAGLVTAGTEHSFLPILYFGVAAIVVFGMTYGSGRLLGSIVESLVFKNARAVEEQIS